MDQVSHELATQLIAKATGMAATDYGRPICIALVDAHGDLLAFARQQGAPVRSIAIAQGKAYSSARMQVNTDAFLERLHREGIQASDFCDPRITSLPGGAVLKNSAGTIIGAVGVSGLKTEEDQAIVAVLAQMVVSAAA